MMTASHEQHLTPRARRTAEALLGALLPPGRIVPGIDATTLDGLERVVGGHAGRRRAFEAGLGLVDRAARRRTGRCLHELSPAARAELVRIWEQGGALRWPLFALGALGKIVHFDRPELYEALGAVYDKSGRAEPARWLAQVEHGDELAADHELECDVVVVGTGAGGAVVGKELAARGHAVVFLEEGALYRRDAFDGRSASGYARFYRHGLVALGNTAIPVMAGRLVGGSTVINGGTCRRGRPWALERWAEALGTDELSAAGLAPYYEQIERELGVTTTRDAYVGKFARRVEQGCEALGWAHSLVPRNAPDCDGQGVCTFGCPSDAKRSMNVSFMPAALSRGAVLFTRSRVDRVLVEDGRAVGVQARTASGRKLSVRARAVVLACGAIHTPLLLLGQGICNRSGQVGRHLKLHPTTMVSGAFDEPLGAYNAVPQPVSCDAFDDDGILLYVASAPPDSGALNFAFSGPRLTELMDGYDRVGTLTVIVIDRSEGRVRRLRSGRPFIGYRLDAADARRIHRGMLAGAEVLRAAGARSIFPLSPAVPELSDDRAFERYRAHQPTARDAILTSVHPLGSCRMSREPDRGVIDADHQAHDLPGLWIVDASSFPTTPGMNPQLTVMALAARAARRIDARLEV